MTAVERELRECPNTECENGRIYTGYFNEWEACPTCLGTGKVRECPHCYYGRMPGRSRELDPDGVPCPKCDGTGFIQEREEG